MNDRIDMTVVVEKFPRPHQVTAEQLVKNFAGADEHTSKSVSEYAPEDWICFVFFWLMTALVIVQFITRYVVNDSYAWTEELAVYCLMPVVFIGSAMCVRRSRHIQVNILYRYLPSPVGRGLSTAVDIVTALFFAYATWMIARYTLAVIDEPMTTIDWRKSHAYWLCCAGFALMTLRSLQLAFIHLRQGYSVLEKPEAYDSPEE